MTTSGTASDNKQSFQLIFLFFFSENKRTTTKHPKENSLNYEEDLEAALLNLEQKQAPKKK